MKSVTVLGGGVSGLAISRHLALNGLQVTCLEKASRAGGWITTERRPNGVLFEKGPHSLRPRAKGNGLRIVELLQDVGLEQEALSSKGTERYVFAKNKLIRLPGSLVDVFTNPLTYRLPPRVVLEALSASFALDSDVTIGEFISKKFGSDMTLLVNAMVAGIFAGDIDQLSIKSCFGDLPRYNIRGKGSMVRGMLLGLNEPKPTSRGVNSKLVKASGVTFPEGMVRLSSVLNDECQRLGVDLKLNCKVESLSKSNDKWLTHHNGTTTKGDLIVSTLAPSIFSTILPSDHPSQTALNALNNCIGKVDVAVVNLCYSSNDVRLPSKAFGHLVAETEVQKSTGCLGVIYDSNAFPEQQPNEWSVVSVMLGGAHAPWIASLNETEWIALARKALSSQMGINIEPKDSCAVLHKNCIPQFKVGHSEAARNARDALKKDGIVMFGTGVLGAGMADSVGGALRALEEDDKRFFVRP